MYCGADYWDRSLTYDMIQMKLPSGREIMTYPNLPKNIYSSFKETVQNSPAKQALVDDDGKGYSYSDLLSKVDRFSSWLLLKGGIRRGDHVALMLYNSVEFCVAFLALNRLGTVMIPLPTKFRKEEVLSLLEKSDVTHIITDEKFQTYFDRYLGSAVKIFLIPEAQCEYAFADYETDSGDARVAEAENAVTAADMALMMFTSGTTSLSKGVTIRNYNIMHAIESYRRTLGITSDDRSIIPVPIYLVTGLIAVFGLAMHTGGTVYLNRFFHAERVLADIKKYAITFLHASPTVFTLLLKEKDAFPELPSMRMFACGSSNMAPGKIRALHDWLPSCEFRTIYGLTETTSPGTVFPVDASQSPYIGSSGVTIPGLTFKIVNENGIEVGPNIQGSVLVKGSNITEHYYKLETNAIQDGWLDTGDIGYFNSDGYLYIVDRKKDMINRGGEKVCSFDIENELSNIPGIADSAVVGVPHEIYGEAPVALIKQKPGFALTEESVKAILKGKIAGYKIPERILFVDDIPVTENMKTDKKRIRKMFE